ncbi:MULTISPECIES: hypothetical protein [unclassified Gilliamella]|uniref:hypothetical protein n=1 Tax=unclassified Gilliamella TaxID=2685620 RepID=UPI00132A0D84|nr:MULTISPECIES: hypothetical protein [unclassified Gilliamella]MWN30967.1 hypothetical protein [Gilliamella sp. Pra-s60]MWP28468.1 hypothetical protein [Gilliamella sp. Pra-s54]
MITDEEWKKLKVGGVVYVVSDVFYADDIFLQKATISKITKAQMKLGYAERLYVQTYNKSQSARLFTNAYDAYKYGINFLSEKQEELRKKINEIESNKAFFTKSYEKME